MQFCCKCANCLWTVRKTVHTASKKHRWFAENKVRLLQVHSTYLWYCKITCLGCLYLPQNSFEMNNVGQFYCTQWQGHLSPSGCGNLPRHTLLCNTNATVRQFVCAVDLHVTVLQGLDYLPRIRLESSMEPHINRNCCLSTGQSALRPHRPGIPCEFSKQMGWERDGNCNWHVSPTRLASLLPRGNVRQAVYIKRIKRHVSFKSGGKVWGCIWNSRTCGRYWCT